MSDIKQEILELKEKMYRLEDEAESLQIRSRTASRTSFYSGAKVYIDNEKMATEAYRKRNEARKIFHMIKDLEKDIK